MVGVILQARLNSTRLPRKALKKIGSLTIVEHCIRAMKRMGAARCIIATNGYSYGPLARYARAYGVDIIAGPDDDVVERFARAARAGNLRTIIRATADNPFVSAACAARAVADFRAARCDYFCYTDLPLGGGVEVFTRSALVAAQRHARSPYDREHVTPYIYNNPDLFAVVRATRSDARSVGLSAACPSARSAGDYSRMRITIDTERDYRRMCRLFALCNRPYPDIETVIDRYPNIDG